MSQAGQKVAIITGYITGEILHIDGGQTAGH
jgi:hypothetical protein